MVEQRTSPSGFEKSIIESYSEMFSKDWNRNVYTFYDAILAVDVGMIAKGTEVPKVTFYLETSTIELFLKKNVKPEIVVQAKFKLVLE
jgi:hypothetical protein